MTRSVVDTVAAGDVLALAAAAAPEAAAALDAAMRVGGGGVGACGASGTQRRKNSGFAFKLATASFFSKRRLFFSVRAPTTSGAMRFFPLGEKRRSFALHLVSFPNPFPNPTWGRASWLYFFGVSGSSDSLRFFLRMLRNSTPDPTRASAATAALRKTLAISTLVHRVGRRSESTFTRFARESSKVA